LAVWPLSVPLLQAASAPAITIIANTFFMLSCFAYVTKSGLLICVQNPICSASSLPCLFWRL
jgi:hypothetical protein